MQPIFTSPNDAQTQVIQSMLRQHGIETSLVLKKQAHQSHGLPKVVWNELWLRDELNMQSATIAITQFQFNTFRKDLRIATPSKPGSGKQTTGKHLPVEATENPNLSADKKHGAELPINNKRVFSYLAEVLGVADQESVIEKTDVNNDHQPWNSKSLMKTVDSLKQICR